MGDTGIQKVLNVRPGEAVDDPRHVRRTQETLDTYGHLWIDDEELTREAVGTELGQALTVST